MLDLLTVLRRCREVVAYHHSLTMLDLVAAIDAHLAQLEAAMSRRRQAGSCPPPGGQI